MGQLFHGKLHRTTPFIITMAVLLIAVTATAIVVLRKGQKASAPQGDTNTIVEVTPEPETPTPSGPVAYTIDTVEGSFNVPWSIVFTGDKRMLVSERSGEISIVQDGVKQGQLARFTETVSQPGNETGLMGLTTDPSYNENKTLYACVTYRNNGTLMNKVVKFTDANNAPNRTVILDNIPAAQYHVGCRLKFGPDKKLYVTLGDATQGSLAQNTNSIAGKILRINTDGSVPDGNPFSNLVWSYGHRNPQGLAWQPGTDTLYESEHGPSVIDGPTGGDEINRIEKGANYGWPLVSHTETREGTIAPIKEYTPAIAPAGALFYSSTVLPQFNGNLFVAALKGEGIYRFIFDNTDKSKLTSAEKMTDVNVGRVRDVAQGPDGYIYFATSNGDGRGKAAAGADKIYRIRPQ